MEIKVSKEKMRGVGEMGVNHALLEVNLSP